MPIPTGNTYTLGTVLQEVVGKNVRLFPVLFKQFRHIQYAFFDVKQLAGEGGLSVKPKEIPGIESTVTADGYRVKWLDYSLFDFHTTVPTGGTKTISGGNITLTLASSAGLAVNDKVALPKPYGSTTADAVDGIVTAISGNDVTIKVTTVNSADVGSTSSVVIDNGQELERLYWRRNDNDEILRPSAAYDYVEYSSGIQHFSRRMEFTKAEMNKEYRYEGEAQNEATKRFNFNIGILLQELNKAIYKGRNTAAGSGATDKMEMLGLEMVCAEAGSIHDLSTSTKPLKDLFDAFEKAFQAGSILGDEPLMMMVNDKFLTELAQANTDKIRYEKEVDTINFQIQALMSAYGEVQLVRDPMLNRLYKESVGFIMPRSLIKLWVRENQEFVPPRGVTRADQSIKIYDVVTNLREKKLYDLEFEMGLICGGLSSPTCPFRMVKNFQA